MEIRGSSSARVFALSSFEPALAMSSDAYLEPVSSTWRTSAWPSVSRPILDKANESAKTRFKSAADLTVHTMQPSQSSCTWTASHNYLDVVGFHGCTRQRNVFRVAQFKMNHQNPSESKMEVRFAQFTLIIQLSITLGHQFAAYRLLYLNSCS